MFSYEYAMLVSKNLMQGGWLSGKTLIARIELRRDEKS